MLSRTTHMIYWTALLVLTAALLRPALVRSDKSPQEKNTPSVTETSANATGNMASSQIAPEAARARDDLLQLTSFDLAESSDVTGGASAQKPGTSVMVKGNRLATSTASSAAAVDWPGADRFSDRPLRGSGPQLTPELVDRCIEVAYDIDADLGSKLQTLRAKDAAAFDQVMHQVGRRLLAMAQLKVRQPDLYQVKLSELFQAVQVNRVAANLRQAVREGNESQAQLLEKQLRSLLQVQLAMSIKSRGEYLCSLEENMQKLRKDIDHEARHFQETIEGRLKHYKSGSDTNEPAATSDSTSPAAELEPPH
jgi:hypothetical protein